MDLVTSSEDEDHPWRKKGTRLVTPRRRLSFASDMGQASGEEEEEEFSHCLYQQQPHDAHDAHHAQWKNEQLPPSETRLLWVKDEGTTLSLQNNIYSEDDTSRGTWKSDSTTVYNNTEDEEEEDDADNDRKQRLRNAGLLHTDTSVRTLDSLPPPPVLDTMRIDEHYFHETNKIKNNRQNSHSPFVQRHPSNGNHRQLSRTSLRPNLSWEKSDDSDLEDIVYEEDSLTDSQDDIPSHRNASRALAQSRHTTPVLASKSLLPPATAPTTRFGILSLPMMHPAATVQFKSNFRSRNEDNEEPYDSNDSIQYEAEAEADETNTQPTIPPLQSLSDREGTGSTASKATNETRASTASAAFDDANSTFVQSAKKNQVAPNSKHEVLNFAVEHRIFVKSILELLGQQNKYAAAAVNMDDPNTIKSGPLKKATHLVRGAWKNKFAEIRRGVFSYYDDSFSKDEQGDLTRKNIPLYANLCTCRAVKLNTKSLTPAPPGHAIFELTVAGGPRRLWMANSREERLSWIRAIQDAMIGTSASIGRGGSHENSEHGHNRKRIPRRSPYKRDLHTYLRIRRDIKNATSKQGYIAALSPLLGKTLNVPVQWITQQTSMLTETDRAFRDEGVLSGVEQLWKDLARDSVEVNGELTKGGDGHAPERIIGALARVIIAHDRSSPLLAWSLDGDGPAKKWNSHWVSELQAMSFTRDILLSANRTRSGGDSYYCVEALCHNPGLVVLVPSSLEAEPVKVNVSHVTLDAGNGGSFHTVNDRSGWLKTRSRPHSPWNKRYFVLSEGTLSIYEMGSPRPHGLRGQIKVADAIMRVDKPRPKNDETATRPEYLFMMSIRARDGLVERQIAFDSREKFLLWAYALESMLRKKPTSSEPSNMPPSGRKKVFRMRNNRDDTALSKLPFTLCENSLQDHADELGFEAEDISARVMSLSNKCSAGRAFSTVKASVWASTTYNICTLDPQGDVREDTWATIKATFTQSFRISGGPNGRMVREEEVVQVDVVSCYDQTVQDGTALADMGVSPRRFKGPIGRKLRRHGNTQE